MVGSEATVLDAMSVMEAVHGTTLPPGLALVVDDQRRLKGLLTDGDVREALLKGLDTSSPVSGVMTRDPITVPEGTPEDAVIEVVSQRVRALGRKAAIRHTPILDVAGRVVGIVDLNRVLVNNAGRADRAGVVGLGFVGLTLAVALAERGCKITGIEINPQVVARVSRGEPHFHERNMEPLLRRVLEEGRFTATTDEADLAGLGTYLVCVNTPIRGGKPDLGDLRGALKTVGPNLRPHDIVIIRSTVPVGTCRDFVIPLLQAETNLTVGKDLGLAYAPERTVAGRALEELRDLPQVIGAVDRWSLEAASRFFAKLCPTIVQAASLEEAEMIKLVNNTHRDISFGFGNEVALACERYNLDAHRVIRSANSGYPRDPIALPSPGVGGACLTKDPYLFLDSLRGLGLPNLAHASRRINEAMPGRIVDRLVAALEAQGRPLDKAIVYVLGLAFKGEPETSDLRGSPAVELVSALSARVGELRAWDPIVREDDTRRLGITWAPIEEGFNNADVAMVLNNHRFFRDMDIHSRVRVMRRPAIVFDGWGLYDATQLERLQGLRYMTVSYLTPR